MQFAMALMQSHSCMKTWQTHDFFFLNSIVNFYIWKLAIKRILEVWTADLFSDNQMPQDTLHVVKRLPAWPWHTLLMYKYAITVVPLYELTCKQT